LKKTREVNGPDLYSPTDDTESNAYSLACVMFACGMDGSTAENINIDEAIAALNEHYHHKPTESSKSSQYPSASALALKRTRWLLLRRLRLSYWEMQLSKEIAANG